jgi:glyoxylase-like metal-dependent hydrolase (beta-lactamase superfamily II)
MLDNGAHVISRRRFLAATGVCAFGAWIVPKRILAQHEGDNLVQQIRAAAATADITVQPLRGNISAMLGSGGNIAVLPGLDGKLLVDAGIPGSRAKMTKALEGISADPIRHLINTHWHFDHTDGNEWLHAAGATILAHENTRKHLAMATRVDDWNFTFPPSPPGALPTDTFKMERVFHINGTAIALRLYAPAHTDSDISVHFVDADVFHTGDTWWNGIYPFIDYSTGGSIAGTIRAAEANIAKVSASTVVIPGHGPVGDRSGLIEFRDMLASIHAKVSALKKQGRSLSEVIAAKPTAPYDAKWGNLVPPSLFTRLVYVGA